jgi:hypothetical protein
MRLAKRAVAGTRITDPRQEARRRQEGRLLSGGSTPKGCRREDCPSSSLQSKARGKHERSRANSRLCVVGDANEEAPLKELVVMMRDER